MLTLLILYVVTGLLLAGLAVPLIKRKVPPNIWYGFRVKATLENEAIWYPVNEYTGWWLLGIGLMTVVVAVVAFFTTAANVGVYASIVGGAVVGSLTVAVLKSFLYLRQLTAKSH
jgi:hypothetical protein